MVKRVVLSGGPGTGKTSIINNLEKNGQSVFHEVSREIIQQELALKSDVLPWDNLFAFSEKVFKGRLADYNNANGLQFYDRSIIDTIAYLHKDNDNVLEYWDQSAKESRYFDYVFITPPWKEIYGTDEERKESYQDLLELHNILCKTYEEYGYKVIIVPKADVEKRSRFILTQLRFL